ncbi:hypothetical protein TL16_g07104 [Triparma laevis f. inornata]|uniref:Uncharacterized protein n=1 Tax=Triparma laevis f. inornata TaxID=1714386 RepID=A0A9W7AP11_9STRA|nr:hypothetical protein TL16_g07104 [Triparma laevis f. inornata]
MPLQCHLVSGIFASLVQVVLFVLSFSSLLLKRHYERPRRPLKVWILDTLKQGFSANLIHFWNILASVLMTRGSLELSDVSNVTSVNPLNNDDDGLVVLKDECALYFITFFLDTTFGVLITFWLMNWTISLSRDYPNHVFESWSNPGDYSVDLDEDEIFCNNSFNNNIYNYSKSDSSNAKSSSSLVTNTKPFSESSFPASPPQPPLVSFQKFGEQLFQWCIVTITMKTIIGTIVFFSSSSLSLIGSMVMAPLVRISPKVELVFVMLVGPVCMNAFQFWVNDNILMRKERRNMEHGGYEYVRDVEEVGKDDEEGCL